MTNAPPEITFRVGNVYAKVWLNKSADGKLEFRSVTLERRYRDDAGKWQSTNSFPLSDLPNADFVLKLACEYVAEREAATGAGHE